MLGAKKYIIINKILLYFLVLEILAGLLFIPKVYCLLTYERTVGKVVGYEIQKGSGRHRSTKHYPIVTFATVTDSVWFLAPSYMYDETQDRDSYPVIFKADEPGSTFVFTLLGFWGSSLVWFLPFVLIWSAIIFGPGFLPKMIKIPLPR